METGQMLYLIDGSAYIYRAYHAIRCLSNSKGLPTNAVFGFTRMLLKLMEDRSPAYVAMFFDAKGPTFRHDLYTDYKANRPAHARRSWWSSSPYIKEVTAAFRIRCSSWRATKPTISSARWRGRPEAAALRW